MLLEEFRCPIENRCTLSRRFPIPCGLGGQRPIDSLFDVLGLRILTDSNDARRVSRVQRCHVVATHRFTANDRMCVVRLCIGLLHRFEQLRANVSIRKIDAPRIAALWCKQIGRRRNLRVRNVIAFPGRDDRIRHDILHVDRLVNDAIDERGIGPIFEQTPHEIWQQVLVAADRRVDTATAVQLVGVDHLGI